MTAEELFALPDNDRIDWRLIRGRLVERPYPFRSPRYAAVIANRWRLLGNWEQSAEGAGRVAYGYGCPFRLGSNPDTLVCFDGSVIPACLDDLTLPQTRFIDGPPTIAIEVADQSDSFEAVQELIDSAMDFGVAMFWLVDPFEDFVEIHRPGSGSVDLGRHDDLIGLPVGPQLRISTTALIE
jgi:Uma2 family endonuclease